MADPKAQKLLTTDQLTQALNVGRARNLDDYYRNQDEMGKLSQSWRKRRDKLAKEIASYQPMLHAVVYGDRELDQETAAKIIHWKNLLVEWRELLKAQGIVDRALEPSPTDAG